jgi:serine/threonine-protein kinase
VTGRQPLDRIYATETTAEEVAFLQDRVARFGRMFAVLVLLALLLRISFALVVPVPASADWVSLGLHAFATLPFLVMWWLCRTGCPSHRFVHAVEFSGLLIGAAALELMTVFLPRAVQPELIGAFVLTYAVGARAVYVPSTIRRTLILNLVIGLPLVALTYWSYRSSDPNTLVEIHRGMGLEGWAAEHIALLRSAIVAAWWTLTTLLVTATTGVIYGLRREARKARQLGQYVLEAKLGEGGMGVVYRACHGMLRRPTAVKLLPAERAGAHGLVRFEREVRLTARLSHPNTVTIYDYGRTDDGVFYYAMELLDGASLGEVVAVGGAMPPSRVLHVLHAVAGALAEAHGVGLIHRDIKPANIILCEKGGVPDVPKVVDFGLVKELSPGASAALTGTHVVAGTPLYMSPESLRTPEDVDARSDLYALGAVGYFMLTGEHVFAGNTVVEIAGHHLHTDPQPPTERLGQDLPADLETVLLECLRKDRAARPQSASELQERLSACKDYGGWGTRRARIWWADHWQELEERRRSALESGSSAGPLTIQRQLGEPTGPSN